MRLKVSVPRVLATRPFGAMYRAIHLVAMVPWLTARPDHTAVTAQSDVHVLEVWNTTLWPRSTRPTRSYGTLGHVPVGSLRKIPLKFPVAESMLKTFRMAPRSLCQIEGNKPCACKIEGNKPCAWKIEGNVPCAEDAAVDAKTRPRATMKRYMLLASKLGDCETAPSSPPTRTKLGARQQA
jgi:hypothetical protein